MSKIEVKVFAEGVAGMIKEYLPEKYQNVECRVSEEWKNNGVERPGLTFHMPGSNMVPIVYMEPFYDDVRKGSPLDTIMKKIAEGVVATMPDQLFPETFDVESYGSIKENLRIDLINTKANRAILLNHPHMDVEDLSVICNIEIPKIQNGQKFTMRVTNGMFAKWGIRKTEMFQTAAENTREKNPPILIQLEDALWWQEDSPVTPENLLNVEQAPDKYCPLYILKNRNKEYGAVAMLYQDILDKICALFPEGYYILPSSTHEVMIAPKEVSLSLEDLSEMIRDANREAIEREEVLSDHIYEYDKDKGKVFLIPESMEKGREAER